MIGMGDNQEAGDERKLEELEGSEGSDSIDVRASDDDFEKWMLEQDGCPND